MALGLLLIGPLVMTALLGDKGFTYGRFGLALVGLGMGLHLVSGTLNQAALARGRAPLAAAAWLIAAALFVLSSRCRRSAPGDARRGRLLQRGAAALRLLARVYRRGRRAGRGPVRPPDCSTTGA